MVYPSPETYPSISLYMGVTVPPPAPVKVTAILDPQRWVGDLDTGRWAGSLA